jgi:hypothetical protein
VSFVHFHERGFGIPVSKFFRGLLHYYGIELQNLNPNSVLQIAVFVTLCEGYLGIKPNFTLWRYYFCATAFLMMVRRGETALALKMATERIWIRWSLRAPKTETRSQNPNPPRT